MKRWDRVRLFVGLGVVGCLLSNACGPNFPAGYVWHGTGERMLNMPRFRFDEAINDWVDYEKPARKTTPQAPYKPWRVTLQADELDLREALIRSGRSRAFVESTVARYVTMRSQLKNAFRDIERHRFLYEAPAPATVSDSVEGYVPPVFDTEPCDALLNALPAEFGFCDTREFATQLMNVAQEQGDIESLSYALHDAGVAPEVELRRVLDYAEFRRTLRFHTILTRYPAPAGFASDEFDRQDFVSLLASLPDEFALYAAGAWHYRCGYYEEAIRCFEDVLALPPTARRYRSTWAAYMLGISWTHLDTKSAIPYFELTRELADRGFYDSTGLAEASREKQVLSEKYEGRFAFAMEHYLDIIKSPGFDGNHHVYDALNSVCRATMEADPSPDYMYRNPEFLEVLSRWALATRYGWDSMRFLEGIKAAALDSPPPGLGRFACAAYRKGLFGQASLWIDMAREDDLHALWVGAKLAQREGKSKTAARLLERAEHILAQDDSWAEKASPQFLQETQSSMLGDLGVAKLNVRNYTGALDAFARGGHWEDAAYVADRVLMKEELRQFLDEVTNDSFYRQEIRDFRVASNYERLAFLLARRYARDDELTRAAAYYPRDEGANYSGREMRGRDESLRELFDTYVLQLKKGRDNSLSRTNRAEALVESAKIARQYGLELFGTEYVPDTFMYGGSFTFPMSARVDGSMTSANERWRVVHNAPTIPHRYHYRWKAAELMWEAARLLPDNDPMTARVLWQGGKWIAIDDPQGADKFYKALVNRCRGLAIGKAADEKRWFPPEPDVWN